MNTKKKNLLILALAGVAVVVAIVCIILVKYSADSSTSITEERIRTDLLESRVFDSISWSKDPDSIGNVKVTKSQTENSQADYWITVTFRWGDVGLMSYKYIDYKVTYKKYDQGWLLEKTVRESESYE